MFSKIAIIGLGSFGSYLVRELSAKGFSILAIDKVESCVDKIKKIVDQALIIDASDEDTLVEIDWKQIDLAIVAIGDPHLESSILVVSLLRQFGVQKIIARASSEMHSRVLRKVGAHQVINPELDMTKILADKISMPNAIDLRYFDEENVISEIIPKPSFLGKSIISLDLRKKYNISVVAIRRQNNSTNKKKKTILNPIAQEVICDGDILVVIGKKTSIENLCK